MSKWQNKSDVMWRTAIRQVGCCERCGVAGIPGRSQGWLNLESHHIITRGHIPYRHMIENGICFCTECHKFSAYAAHNDRTGFENWLHDYRPGIWDWYMEHTVPDQKEIGNELITVYRPIVIPHVGDKKEYEILKEMVKSLEG